MICLNPYTFHINLYDLIFLGVLFIGLTFALLLWFTPKINQAANRFLALALAVVVLWIAWLLGIDIRLETYVTNWSRLPLHFSLALGPLMFFYVLKLTMPESKFRWKDLLHFSPLLLELGIFVLEIKESIKTGAATYDTLIFHQLNAVLQALAFVSVTSYLYWSFRLIKCFYQGLKFNQVSDRYRFELRWLHNLLTGFGLLWLLWIPFTAIDYFGYHYQPDLHFYYSLYLLLAIIVIWMAAATHLRAKAGRPAEAPLFLKPSLPAEMKQRGIWLKKAVQTNYYYQDPELSLVSLAEKLELTTHELSRIINTALKKSFNDFINEFRVAEVARKMENPAYGHITLLGIAYESGFNSQSTFTRAFKYMTGKTPLEYKNDLKKHSSSYNLGSHPRFAPLILHHETTQQWSQRKLNRNYMFRNYLKIASRNLWRHKRMTMINVAGLSIGMAATVLIALWVQSELSFDKFQPDAENIYRIKAKIPFSRNETWLWETSQYVLGEFAPKQTPEIADLTRIRPNNPGGINFHYGGNIITENKSAYVDGRWFNVFHYDFVDGNADAFNKNPFSLILTASTAIKYFGNQEPVGKILRIDTIDYQVQAVVKDNPANSSFQYNVFLPVAAQLTDPDEKKDALKWDTYNYRTFIKLKAGSHINAVSAKLSKILLQNDKDNKDHAVYSLVNVRDMHFENDLTSSSAFIHGNRTIVNVFIVLAVLLLATACINYVNLTTARASLRSKEVSVRKIVGAGRLHLFGQFMSESFLVSFLALALAVGLIQGSMPWFRSFTGKEFGEPLTSPVIWLIIGSTLTVSFLLNGLYPAILLSSFQPVNVFRGKAMLNFKDASLRRLLVVVQFTISVILIIGTLVIYSQLNYVQKMDPGYNRAHIFSFTFPWWKVRGMDFKKSGALLNTVKQELKAQSAIADVAMADPGIVDFGNENSGRYDWNGRPKDFNPALAPLEANADFQRLMNIQIKDGRWFNDEKSDLHNVLLNETAVRTLNIEKPVIGQRFINRKDTGVIIGVVKDFHYKSLHDKIGPMVITNGTGSGLYVKTAPGRTAAAIAAAATIWKKAFPDEPFTYDFLDERYNDLYKTEQQSSLLISLFAGIAILVSALGLLGLAAFAAEQKVKEIGIRKVLGASMQHIVSLLSVDFLKMVLVASLIAFPIAWWAMNKWLQGFAYRISLSWWIFVGAAGIALLIALVTVSFQSIRAAIANPAKSLRIE